LRFDVDAPPDRIGELIDKAVRYCVVLQTLRAPPTIVVT
jgi:hypothetical protein